MPGISDSLIHDSNRLKVRGKGNWGQRIISCQNVISLWRISKITRHFLLNCFFPIFKFFWAEMAHMKMTSFSDFYYFLYLRISREIR